MINHGESFFQKAQKCGFLDLITLVDEKVFKGAPIKEKGTQPQSQPARRKIPRAHTKKYQENQSHNQHMQGVKNTK